VHLDLVEVVRVQRSQPIEACIVEAQRIGQRADEERVTVVEVVFYEVEHDADMNRCTVPVKRPARKPLTS